MKEETLELLKKHFESRSTLEFWGNERSHSFANKLLELAIEDTERELLFINGGRTS